MQNCIAMNLPRTKPAQHALEQLREEELRHVLARGYRRGGNGCRFMNGGHGFVVRDFLVFLALRFEVSDPKSRKIQTTRVAHAPVILHVRAFRTFEEQRRVAGGAELHAIWILRAAFRTGHK